MKKRYIGALAAALVLCTAALSGYAQTRLTAGVDEAGKATVRIVTDSADPDGYMLYILKPGATRAAFAGADGRMNGVYKINQMIEGSAVNDTYTAYTYTFPVRTSDEAGAYTVFATGGELDRQDTQLVLPDSATEQEALKTVKSAPTEESLRAYQSTVWYVNLEDATYRAHKEAVLNSFGKLIAEAACGGDVQEAFTVACALVELQYAGQNQIYDLLAADEYLFGIPYGSGVQSRDTDFLSSFVNLRADNRTNPMTTPAELSALLYRAEALSAVNVATRDTLISTLKSYADVFGDFDGRLDGADAYALGKAVVVTDGKVYTSIAQVVDAVTDALNQQGKPAETQRPSKPGRGGSGVGGGIAAGSVVSPGSATPEIMDQVSPLDEGDGSFRDLKGSDWAEAYIEYLNYKGIMTGDGNGLFRPKDAISREEFSKVVLTALKITPPQDGEIQTPDFADVDANAWYYSTVQTAYHYGIVTGIDANAFGVGTPITRQDAAVLITRARVAMAQAYRSLGDSVSFSDQDDIADYAADAVTELQKAGVLNGYENGTFRPTATITRAETAKLIYSLLDKLGKL